MLTECAKTSNCCFLLLEDCNLRLLPYRDKLTPTGSAPDKPAEVLGCCCVVGAAACLAHPTLAFLYLCLPFLYSLVAQSSFQAQAEPHMAPWHPRSANTGMTIYPRAWGKSISFKLTEASGVGLTMAFSNRVGTRQWHLGKELEVPSQPLGV